MAKVYRRGKTYYYSVTISGRQVRKSTGETSKKKAQEIADAAITRLRKSAEVGFDADLTLREAILNYVDDGKYTGALELIMKKWGSKPIHQITPDFVRREAKVLKPKCKPQTWNREIITPVQAVINHAYQQGDGRTISIAKFTPEDVKTKEAVDAKWHEKFIKHAPRPHMHVLARFMFVTAARISEALRVQWEDIDFDAGTVQFHKTKTKPRTAVVPKALLTEIQNLKRYPGRGVFFYKSRNSVYNGWKSACEDAGIEYATPHAAGRHSFATEMIVRNQVDPTTAASMGGWASPKLMMDTYSHSEGEKEIAEKIFGDT